MNARDAIVNGNLPVADQPPMKGTDGEWIHELPEVTEVSDQDYADTSPLLISIDPWR